MSELFKETLLAFAHKNLHQETHSVSVVKVLHTLREPSRALIMREIKDAVRHWEGTDEGGVAKAEARNWFHIGDVVTCESDSLRHTLVRHGIFRLEFVGKFKLSECADFDDNLMR